MKRVAAIRLLLAGQLLLCLAGCVVVPTGRGTVIRGEAMTGDQLAFLDDPATRQADVDSQFGEPDLIWPEARVHAYHWEVVDGVAVWALPFPGGYGGTVGYTGLSSKYVLLIQFDAEGRVLRHESRGRPVMNSYGDMIREWVASPVPDKQEPAKAGWTFKGEEGL